MTRTPPRWFTLIEAAKAKILAELPPHEFEDMQRRAREARIRSMARRILIRDQAAKIIELWTDGSTTKEIGAALGRSADYVFHFARPRGIMLTMDSRSVTLAVKLTIERRDALASMASDQDLSVRVALEKFINFAFADDAAIARRIMRVHRKK